MQPLTPDDVKAALKALQLDIDMTFFDATTATSEQAAEQIGCKLGQIVKSIGFMIDAKPVLVLASGDGMVDDRKLADIYRVGRKKVKIAKPEQLIEVWGYAPGGVPPFGHRTSGFPVHMDDALKRFDTLYAAGGAHNAIFAIDREILMAKAGATYADVRKDS